MEAFVRFLPKVREAPLVLREIGPAAGSTGATLAKPKVTHDGRLDADKFEAWPSTSSVKLKCRTASYTWSVSWHRKPPYSLT